MFFLAGRKVGLKGVEQQGCWEITAALGSSESSPSHVDMTCTSMTHGPIQLAERDTVDSQKINCSIGYETNVIVQICEGNKAVEPLKRKAAS